MAEIDQLPLNTFVVVTADETRKIGIVVGRRAGGVAEGSFPDAAPAGNMDMLQVLVPTSLTSEWQTTGYTCFPASVDLATPEDLEAMNDKSWMRRLEGSLAIRLHEQNGLVMIRLLSTGATMTLPRLDWLSLPVAR